MKIRFQRRGLVPALVLAVLGTVLLYFGTTAGVSAWHHAQASPGSGAGYLPEVVENAPPSLPTTSGYGPPGSVALVYAGTEVDAGLTGQIDNPWIAISAQTGEYRALAMPGLPAPGRAAMSLSPDGATLAWVGDEGVVLYDAVTGEESTLPMPGVDAVGAFSEDGSLLAVHAEGLQVLDLASGEVVASTEATTGAVARAVWRPDGSAIDHVAEGRLVTVQLPGGVVDSQPIDAPADAELAWSPSGDRLAYLHDRTGNNRLFVADLERDGTLGPGRQVETSGIALLHLFGFSGTRTVAVDAYLLESGAIERVLDVPLEQGSVSDLTLLPSPGQNWVDTATLQVAADTLLKGSYAWDRPVWPWSHLARLMACALVMLFLLGLFVTRRPRQR